MKAKGDSWASGLAPVEMRAIHAERKPEVKSHRRCSDGTRMLVTSTESDQETQRKSQSRTDWGQKRLAPEISADYQPPSLPWKNWKSISEEQLWSLLRSILKSLTLAPTYKHKCIRVHMSAHTHRCPGPPTPLKSSHRTGMCFLSKSHIGL